MFTIQIYQLDGHKSNPWNDIYFAVFTYRQFLHKIKYVLLYFDEKFLGLTSRWIEI